MSNQIAPGLVIEQGLFTSDKMMRALGIINRILGTNDTTKARDILQDLPYTISFDDMIEYRREKAIAEGTLDQFNFTYEDAIQQALSARDYFNEQGFKTEVIMPESSNEQDAEILLLAKMIEVGGNLLFQGPTGVGKTAMARAACKAAGIAPSAVAYFSLPTLAPEDFVGIPSPDPDNKHLFYYRMLKTLNSTQVMILDETNRAHPKIMNALMQLMGEKKINDMEFPDLRAIICCINPPEDGDYLGTEELDQAVRERLDYFIEVVAKPSAKIISRLIGPGGVADDRSNEVAECIVEWYNNDINDIQRKQLNPRRLEKIGRAYMNGIDITKCIDQRKSPVPLTTLIKKLKNISVFNLKTLLADPATAEKILQGNDGHAHDYQFRYIELVKQMQKQGRRREFATVAHLMNYVSHDQVPSVLKNKGLWSFCNKAIDQYATPETAELWRAQMKKRQEEKGRIMDSIKAVQLKIQEDQNNPNNVVL